MTDKPHSRYRHLHCIVRFNLEFHGPNPEDGIAIVKACESNEQATAEVERLTALNSHKGYKYMCMVTRLIDDNRAGEIHDGSGCP